MIQYVTVLRARDDCIYCVKHIKNRTTIRYSSRSVGHGYDPGLTIIPECRPTRHYRLNRLVSVKDAGKIHAWADDDKFVVIAANFDRTSQCVRNLASFPDSLFDRSVSTETPDSRGNRGDSATSNYPRRRRRVRY